MSESDVQKSEQNITNESPVQSDAEAMPVALLEATTTTSSTPKSAPVAPVTETPAFVNGNSNGASLKPSSPDDVETDDTPTESPGETEADTKAKEELAALLTESKNEDSTVDNETTLGIDQRRAKQLLDRAILLSERGDLAGAILASRQAVALAPGEPAGHSMLGLLHERAGDLEKAINAYEKVLQLAPQSTLERDSLDRLKATLESENSSVVFHFDDNELFEEPPVIAPVPAEEATAESQIKPVAATAVVATATALAAQPQIPVAKSAATPPLKADATASNAQSEKPQVVLSSSAVASSPLVPAKSATGRPGLIPLTMPATAQQPSLNLLLRKPSFYFKGAPVVAATTLGLLFMGWAQGVSQNKFLDETLPGSKTTAIVEREPATNSTQAGAETPVDPGVKGPSVPSQAANPPAGGGIFGSGTTGSTSTAPSVASPVSPAPRVSSSAGAATSGSSGGGSGSSAPVNARSLPPAIPQPDGAAGNSAPSGNGSSGGLNTLETLPVLRPRSAPSEVVRPSAPTVAQGTTATGSTADNGSANANGNSSQGGMFNPSSSPRGFIRIDPVRPVNPVVPVPRPANEARAAENAASRAAAAGRTNEVVPSLNRAIERQATGYNYQRRAMAWLEQGDFGRAADDFQSAIAGYEDQIRRGQNVEDARNGISTCRSGLNLALSRMGR